MLELTFSADSANEPDNKCNNQNNHNNSKAHAGLKNSAYYRAPCKSDHNE